MATLLFLMLLAGFSPTRQAYAATIDVTTFDDNLTSNGDCSLREAIQAANTDSAIDACPAGSGADIIQLSAGTYTLDIAGADEDQNRTGDLDIFGNLTIKGIDASTTQITNTVALDRVIQILPNATVTLIGVSISNGHSIQDGGAISNGGTLTLTGVTVTQSSADGNGGGIYNNNGTLTIDGSTISNNHAGNNGGGIDNAAGAVVLNDSIVNDNSGGNNGGGIYNDGALDLINVSLNTNRAAMGDGIYTVETTQPMTLTNVTLAYNGNGPAYPGEGTYSAGAAPVLLNTLIAGNGTQGDCAGPLASAGHNLEYGDTCGLSATGDITDTDPLLGPFQNNGGETATYALLPGSPAINGGTNAGCPAVDQRGMSRPHGASCDIGAFEANDAPHTVSDSYSTDEDTQLTIAAPGLLSNDGDPDNDAISATLVTAPAHGGLALAPGGGFSYTPNADYHGPDSFSYRVSDGSLVSASTPVTLTVISVNDPPTATGDTASTAIDTPLIIPAAMLLSNDTDVDGDPLSISAVRGNSARGGRVMLADGNVVYTPPTHFSGVDSLIYTLSDGHGGTASGTVTMTVGMRHLYLPIALR